MKATLKKPELKDCNTCRLHNSPYCRECYDFDKYASITLTLEDFAQ